MGTVDEASPEQAPGYHREGHWSVRHHGFSRSSLCKVTSEQAPRNLLIELSEETYRQLTDLA